MRCEEVMQLDINSFYAEIDRLFSEKKIDKAEMFLKEQLDAAERTEDFEITVAACNELGGLYRQLSRYEEGIPLYEKALSALKKRGMDRDINFATTLINYATILNFMGNSYDALDKYAEALKVLSLCISGPDYRMAALYNNMSAVYQKEKEFETSAAYLMKALLILEQLDEGDIDIAITYSNLAGVYIEMDRPELAEEYAEKAVKIFTETSGDRDVHYAAAVCSLAEVKFMKGEYDDALKLFEKGLELTARDYGRDNDTYRKISSNIDVCRERIEEI